MYKINCENIGDVKKYVWHYRKGNSEHGPFTYEDIIEMVRKGEIGPEDYVLRFGNRKFVKARELQGLFDAIPEPEVIQRAQIEVPLKEVSEVKEEINEELHVAFDHSVNNIQQRHKKEPFNQKTAMIVAGLLGLSLAIWLLLRIF